MSDKTSLYWHDYETFGANPKYDRPVQFAGIRTDTNLNPIGEPLTLYCRPSEDYLPHPEACLVTGITPQKAMTEGGNEADFITRIHTELARPGTCGVGYNTIRFDDEVTRYTLFRNFFDPYAREWQNGNSRWDIIDMVRLTYALRPDGIEWPCHPDGRNSFRLEDLTAANGIGHSAAHDALSDVHATIALARLIRDRQPRLYDFIFSKRRKRDAAEFLNLARPEMVVHISSRYPSERGCMAVVMPIAPHPTNSNGIVVYDLRFDPTPLLTQDADALRKKIFTPTSEMAEGEERIPIKTVHLNKCPVLCPLNTLRPEDAERHGVDLDLHQTHFDTLRAATGLQVKIGEALQGDEFPPEDRPEQMLYGGGFFSSADKARMEEVRSASPSELTLLDPPFQDPRLPELLFNYRARNYPESLTPEEQQDWKERCREWLTQMSAGPQHSFESLSLRLEALRLEHAQAPEKLEILAAVEAYAQELRTSLDL